MYKSILARKGSNSIGNDGDPLGICYYYSREFSRKCKTTAKTTTLIRTVLERLGHYGLLSWEHIPNTPDPLPMNFLSLKSLFSESAL